MSVNHFMQCDLPSETNQQTMDDFCKDNSFLGYFPTSAKEDIGIGDAARSLVAEVRSSTHMQCTDVQYGRAESPVHGSLLVCCPCAAVCVCVLCTLM